VKARKRNLQLVRVEGGSIFLNSIMATRSALNYQGLIKPLLSAALILQLSLVLISFVKVSAGLLTSKPTSAPTPLVRENPGFYYNLSFYETNAPKGLWKNVAADGTGQQIYAILNSGSTSALYMSKDFGFSWQQSSLDLHATYTDDVYYSGSYWYDGHCFLIVDSDTGCHVNAGCSRLYGGEVSADCGEMWTSSLSDSFGNIFSDIAGDSKGENLVSFSRDGSYAQFSQSTTYGYTWTSINSVSLPPYSITSDAQRMFVAAAGCPTYSHSSFYGNDDNYLYQVFVSTTPDFNINQPWTTSYINLDTACSEGIDIETNDAGDFVILTVQDSVYMLSDSGSVWTLVESAPEGITWNSVACDDTCGRIAIGGNISTAGVVYYSDNYGVTWVQVNTSSDMGCVNEVTVSSNGQFIVAATSTGVYVSSDPYMQRLAVVPSNSSSVNVSFTDVGYVCDTLYLSAAIVTSADASLAIIFGDESNIQIYNSTCSVEGSPMDEIASRSRTCFVSLELNRSLVTTAEGGTISFMVNIATDAPCLSSNVCFETEYLLSVRPWIPQEVVADNVNVLSVLVAAVVAGCMFMFAAAADGRSGDGICRFRTTHFGLLGVLVAFEIWMLCQTSTLNNLKLPCLAYVAYASFAARIIIFIPGFYTWGLFFDVTGVLKIRFMSRCLTQSVYGRVG
jgi:photosystem II stability/assembly factor-like uncharacterized protein